VWKLADIERSDHDRSFKELSISPVFLRDYILDVGCSLAARAPYGIMESKKYIAVTRIKLKILPLWK